MLPRPIHRWKTLWLGVFILTFLGWAWVRSRSHSDHAGFRLGPRTWYGITSRDGYVSCGASSYSDLTFMPPGRTTIDSHPSRGNRSGFPPAFMIQRAHDPDRQMSYYRIAYWLIIPLFLVSWSALLFRRRKKANRLTTPHTEVASTP